MRVSFRSVDNFEGWQAFPPFIGSIILENRLQRVVEVGAGANPAISREFVEANRLEYLAIDRDAAELGKGEGDNLTVFDLCDKACIVPGAPYDLIFGRMAAEHFRDATAAYENMLQSLTPGGILVQSFACLSSLPFLVNAFTPEPISDFLLSWTAPERDRVRHEKFKAHYRRCRGPIPNQLSFLEGIGFQILEYRTYFGHHYYERRLGFLDRIEKAKTRLLLRMPIPHLASYATIVLRRPI